MAGICYIHNDNSCLYNDNILIAQASTVFNVCRCNNLNFKMFKCRQCVNKIHICIKNCSNKCLNNIVIKLNTCDEYINIGCLNIGEQKCYTISYDCYCRKYKKIIGEVLIGSDVVCNSCIFL